MLLVTATRYIFSCLTWLKVVEPRVRMGERTWALEMTWMRNTSARRGRQSLRKARKMRFSPFWLKMRIPESIAEAETGGQWWRRGEERQGWLGYRRLSCVAMLNQLMLLRAHDAAGLQGPARLARGTARVRSTPHARVSCTREHDPHKSHITRFVHQRFFS